MENTLMIIGQILQWIWFPILVVFVIFMDHKWDRVWQAIVWVWNRIPRIWWGVLLAFMLFYMGQIFTSIHGTFIWGHRTQVFEVILHMDQTEQQKGTDGLNSYVNNILSK